MNKLQIILAGIALVLLLIGGLLIQAEPAYAIPACCHCMCDCNNPDPNIICYAPTYQPQNCASCGTERHNCGSGLDGGWCQW